MSEIFFGPSSIDRSISTLLKPIFSGNKKEFTIINNLAKNWQEVIGKNYVKFCYPKSISFGQNYTNKKQKSDFQNKAKLTIAVTNSAVGFFLESNSEIIIERIARLYGYKAIDKIIIKQEPRNESSKQDSSELNKDSSSFNSARINQLTKTIKDQELAEILIKLAK